MQLSDLDLVYVGSEHDIIMIEGSALELPEADFKAALDYAQEQVQIVIKLQKDLASRVNKAKRTLPLYVTKPEYVEMAYGLVKDRIEGAGKTWSASPTICASHRKTFPVRHAPS